MQSSLKQTLLILLALIIMTSGLIYVLEATNTTHFFGNQEQSKAEADVALEEKKSVAESNASTSNTPKSDKNSRAGEYNTPTSSENLVLTTSQSDTDVIVSTKLYGYSDGDCALTITNGGKTVTEEAPVMFQREFSTCAGFSIPTRAVGPGNWNIRLTVTSGGISTSQTTTLGVK